MIHRVVLILTQSTDKELNSNKTLARIWRYIDTDEYRAR